METVRVALPVIVYIVVAIMVGQRSYTVGRHMLGGEGISPELDLTIL